MRRTAVVGSLSALACVGALAFAGGGSAHHAVHGRRSGAAQAPAEAQAAQALAEAQATQALAEAQATHEYPSPPPPRQTARSASANPVQAVRAFATAYINWSAQTVALDMAALAQASVGQARSAMVLAAAETAGDYELQRGGIANHGTVEAVAPLPGRTDQYVVVTLESTTATNTTAYEGLRPAWHVAVATVTEQRPGQWVLSGWQPEG